MSKTSQVVYNVACTFKLRTHIYVFSLDRLYINILILLLHTYILY